MAAGALRKSRVESPLARRNAADGRDVFALSAYRLFFCVFCVMASTILLFSPWFLSSFMAIPYTAWRDLTLRYAASMFTFLLGIAKALDDAVASGKAQSEHCRRMAFNLALGTSIVCITRTIFSRAGYSVMYYLCATGFQLLPTMAFVKLYGIRGVAAVVPETLCCIPSVVKSPKFLARIYRLVGLASLLGSLILLAHPQSLLALLGNAAFDTFAEFILRVLGGLLLTLSLHCFLTGEVITAESNSDPVFHSPNISSFLSSVFVLVSSLYVACPFQWCSPAAEDAPLINSLGWTCLVGFYGTVGCLAGYNVFKLPNEHRMR